MPAFEKLSWWREHGEHYAHVDPIPTGGWLISLWVGHTCIMEGSRRFQRLTTAKAAADVLIRRSQHHRCDIDTCGDWVAVAR